MKCFDASKGKPQRELTPIEEKAFEEADNLMRGAVISVLGENIVDSYLSLTMGKDMWDVLEAKFGVSDTGSELYVMEQFFDYKMTDERTLLSRIMRYSPLLKNSSSSRVCYRTSLLPEASLPSFLPRGGILLLL
jgi:hypothetical protein